MGKTRVCNGASTSSTRLRARASQSSTSPGAAVSAPLLGSRHGAGWGV
jgi:hypothetical protein